MTTRRRLGRLGITLLFLSLLGAATALTAPPASQNPSELVEADKLYAEKSYAGALAIYSDLLRNPDALPEGRREDVAYRVAVSLGKTKQWDRALEASLDFVKTHRGTVWEPRGLYWLGRLYLGVPNAGWRVGKRVFRGEDVPQAEAGNKPERVYLGQQDQQNARDALEAARVLYPKFRADHKTQNEEIALNFDLARVLMQGQDLWIWAQKREWPGPKDAFWRIDRDSQYSLDWPLPKKMMFLHEQIGWLADEDAPGRTSPAGRHSAALALFARALWLRQYHGVLRNWAVRWEDGKQIKIPYPYEDVLTEDVLQQLVRAFPLDPVRDQAQFTLGLFREQDERFVAALEAYRALIAERPASKWVADARQHRDEILRRRLDLQNTGPQMPGKTAKVQISFRNVSQIRFRVYRVRLEEGIDRPERLRDPEVRLSHFRHLLDDIKTAPRFYGPPVAQWSLETKDPGEHRYLAETVDVPVREVGAYAIEASAPGVRSVNLLLVTDLVLVQKTHRDGALFFAADARTGAPVARASLLAKQWYYDGAENVHRERAAFSRGRTDAEGIHNVAFERGPRRSNFRMAAFAWRGNRYALTGEMWGQDRSDNPETFRVYSVTDRSVYRPKQIVHYRQLVMHREAGLWRPLAGKSVHVEIRDPQGRVVLQKDAATGEFGSVNGQLALADGAPLGEYQVYVTVPDTATSRRQLGGNRFRVEEYKKPEFEVAVIPAAERVRLGEPTRVTIKASYYFGGPVPNAKITYRVYRNAWAQSYRFPRPFDFLYRYFNQGDYDTNYRNGEVFAQGEARTNEKGEATVSFATKAEATRWGSSDLSYTVEADVQDASRRVISGTGTVKATRHDVAVFLDYPNGYARRGDEVKVEIRTMNPSDRPVSAPGTAKVFRLPATPDKKEKLIFEKPLKTDDKGYAIFAWKATEGGAFRVAFVTHDSARQEVSGSTGVWVQGPELARGGFLLGQGVALQVEKPYYEEDQTARVLLLTPEPDATVLLTREANNQILDRQVLRIPGRSREIRVPLSRRDVPNVYVTAILIRDNQMHQATQELFVPPARQFTKVTVQADKARYQPGETAKLRLVARDWRNRPLRTELSLSVFDAAVNYIQKDYAPDIRAFFYGDRRSQSIQNNGSAGTWIAPDGEDTQERVTYQTHEWVLPEGMGLLPDWPGDEQQGRYDLYNYNYRGYYGGRMAGGFGGGGFATVGGFAADAVSEVAAAMPASRPEAAEVKRMAINGLADADMRGNRDKNESGPGGLAQPALRNKFADTAFWTPAVVTDKTGSASVTVTWPDNLTQWRAQAVGSSAEAQVGSGETRVTTRKNLLVRLQAPRFFVERDLLVLSANVHNYGDKTARTRVRLDLGGEGAAETTAPRETWLDIPKNGERRVDWTVRVQREGDLRVRMTAQAATGGDAAEMTLPILVHGVERMTAQAGTLRGGNGEARAIITLPAERKPGSSELVVQLNPSLGAIMLDALPYLADYPYGCIEQTMSRFLPSVVVAKTLKDLGYDLGALKERARLREAKQAEGGGAKPVANSPYTYPQGRPGIVRIDELSRYQQMLRNPVFDQGRLKAMVTEGLQRIAAFQHADGGWGWWPADASDPHMSAYVLYGLLTARGAGYAVDAGMIERGLQFLRARFLEDDNFHRMAYLARVLAMEPGQRDAIRPLVVGRLFENRERLSAYSRALLALALHGVGDAEKAGVLLRNLETTAKVDAANGTASWEGADTEWWRWYNNKVETNAAALQAYVTIRPDDAMTARLVKWLVNNRRGNIWTSTRETAMSVYALADYVRVSKELAPAYTLSVDLGGRVRRTYTVSRENALFFDGQFVVPDELLRTGEQTLTLTKQGEGTLYWSAFTRTFSLEDKIKAAGNEIFVTRRYFRLLPGTASGQPEYVALDPKRPNPFLTGKYELLDAGGEWTGTAETEEGPRYQRVGLEDGATVVSGDLLEVELQLESKNDYDYLVFEDLKPAGCEAVELRSGGRAGLGVYSNMELRDQKVAFFLSALSQGKRTLSYRLRAEIPGRFNVLPTNGYAMYAPDIRTISDGMKLNVNDENDAKRLARGH